MANLIAQHSI